MYNLDSSEVFGKVLKYGVNFGVILLALRFIPEKPIEWKNSLTIAFVSGSVFALLDMYSPSVSITQK